MADRTARPGTLGGGVRRHSRRLRGGGLLLVVASIFSAATASPAVAFGRSTPCTTRDTSAAFARWLDPAQYFPAANGGFEQGSGDWRMTPGASVVTGNEPFRVAHPTDAHSLSLTSGAAAVSRTACVTLGEPTVRLFVNAPRVLGATLRIDASVRNPATKLTLSTSYVVLGALAPTGWAPTPPIVIPNLLGGILPEDLTLRFTASGTPATWGVDDVYVDPYKQR